MCKKTTAPRQLWSDDDYKVTDLNLVKSRVFIVQYCTSFVLVDTGNKSDREQLEQAVQSQMPPGAALAGIVLTHCHHDHAGNAAYFSGLYRCPVYGAPRGLEALRTGRDRPIYGTGIIGRLLCRMLHLFDRLFSRKSDVAETDFEPCLQAQEPVRDGEIWRIPPLGPSVVLLPTPGHTVDSLSVVMPGQWALVGDALFNLFSLKYPPFAEDEQALKDSWKKLLDTDCVFFYPAHGKGISRAGLVKLARARGII